MLSQYGAPRRGAAGCPCTAGASLLATMPARRIREMRRNCCSASKPCARTMCATQRGSWGWGHGERASGVCSVAGPLTHHFIGFAGQDNYGAVRRWQIIVNVHGCALPSFGLFSPPSVLFWWYSTLSLLLLKFHRNRLFGRDGTDRIPSCLQ